MATTDKRVVTITTIPASQAGALTEASKQGSASAIRIMRAVEHLFADIERAPKPCLTCATAIEIPRGVTVVIALRGADLDNPTEMAGSAVCTACAVAPDIDERILTALEDWHVNLCPGLDVHATAGRA